MIGAPPCRAGPELTGELYPSDEDPVRLALGDGAPVACQEWSFAHLLRHHGTSRMEAYLGHPGPEPESLGDLLQIVASRLAGYRLLYVLARGVLVDDDRLAYVFAARPRAGTPATATRPRRLVRARVGPGDDVVIVSVESHRVPAGSRADALRDLHSPWSRPGPASEPPCADCVGVHVRLCVSYVGAHDSRRRFLGGLAPRFESAGGRPDYFDPVADCEWYVTLPPDWTVAADSTGGEVSARRAGVEVARWSDWCGLLALGGERRVGDLDDDDAQRLAESYRRASAEGRLARP